MGKIMDTIMGNTMENKWEVNGKWVWNLMDEQMDFIMEMKMGKLMDMLMGNTMENEFGKRFDYNEKRV